MKRKFNLIFLTFFFSGNLICQQLDIQFQRGFLLAHREVMQHMVKGYSSAISVEFEKTINSGNLSELYNKPQAGLGLYAIDFNNDTQIGKGISIYPYFNFHLFQKPKLFWDMQFGWGLGWLSKKYERVNNYQNVAIGSRFNCFFNLRTDLHFQATSRLRITAGLGFSHFSNGAFQLPNLGLNVPSINIGASYGIKAEPGSFQLTKNENKHKKGFRLAALIGAREAEPNSSNIFLGYNLLFRYLKPINQKLGVSIGTDFFYKPSLIERANLNQAVTTSPSPIQAGVMVCYHQLFYPFDLYLGFGAYLIDTFKNDGIMYNRLGIRYQTQTKWFYNFNIYSHGPKADQFQLGVGLNL